MKIEVTTEQLQAVSAFPIKSKGNLLFASVPKAGKIELNLSRGEWVVGSGSKHLESITKACEAAGFKVAKRANAWTYLTFESVAHFPSLVAAVCAGVPDAVTLPPKAKRAAKTIDDQITDAVTARQKNLATIKKVSASRARPVYRKEVKAVPTEIPGDDEDPREYVPQMFWKEVGIA